MPIAAIYEFPEFHKHLSSSISTPGTGLVWGPGPAHMGVSGHLQEVTCLPLSTRSPAMVCVDAWAGLNGGGADVGMCVWGLLGGGDGGKGGLGLMR